MMLCLLCSHIIFCCMSIQNNTQYSGEDFYVNVAAGKNFFFKSHFRFLKKKMFLIFAFTLCHRSPFRWTLQQNPSMYYWSKCNSQNLHNFGASFQEFLKQPSKRFSIKPYVPWGACMCTCDHGSTTGSSGQHPLELVEYCCLLVSLQSNSKAITLWSWPHMGTPVK